MLTHKIPQGTIFPLMSQFLGTHHNRLDAKGRVSVPASFRAVLKALTGTSELILRPSHFGFSIEAWPIPKFNDLENDLKALNKFSQAHQDLATTLYADAFSLEIDKEGRILLPDFLVKYAKLTDAVVFMGAGATFQIWEPVAAAARSAEARERTRARLEAAEASAQPAFHAAGGG
jgi:MraZ protein